MLIKASLQGEMKTYINFLAIWFSAQLWFTDIKRSCNTEENAFK